MTTATLPVPRGTPVPGFLSALTALISTSLVALKTYRQRRSDMALLMAMEPQLLKDIGVLIVHTPHDGRPMLGLHPAVLATTMNTGTQTF